VGAEKALIRAAAAHDLGARLDDALDAAEKAERAASGGAGWVKRAAAAVLTLHADIDVEVDAGKLLLSDAKIRKDLVTLAHRRALAVASQAEDEHKVAAGQVAGLKLAVALTKKQHDEDRSRAEALVAREVAGDVPQEADARIIGQRPPPTMKARRLAEDAPMKKARKRGR
jgi:hypothetical protein